MGDITRRQSLTVRNRDSLNRKQMVKRPSQTRAAVFNAEKESTDFFYRRERSLATLPKLIIEQVFGGEFIEKLLSRSPAAKRRQYSANQFEDITRLVRLTQRQITTAETFYTKVLSILPNKTTSDKAAPKARLSIFGNPHKNVPSKAIESKKLARSTNPAGGFGHFPKGKKVNPITQILFEDKNELKQVLNITREDFNPSSPVNTLMYSAKEGVVQHESGISQSQVIFHQIGEKIRTQLTKGKALVEERDARYPMGADGNRIMRGPRRRYNFIESTFRSQQIWPKQSFEVASQTDPLPIGNFTAKMRTYSVQDLYISEQKRKKAENAEHKSDVPHHPSVQGSGTSLSVGNQLLDTEQFMRDYSVHWKLVLVAVQKAGEETKRKVADGAEWPACFAPTKTISQYKQKLIKHIYRGLKLMEKLVLQPFHHPIANDYRYFEDLLDVGRKNGSALPLWNFSHPRLKDVKVEYALWHPRYPDMFVCAGGRDEVWDSNVGSGQTAGFVCWFSLRNPTYPEYLQYVSRPVTTFDIHQRGFIVVAGTNSGNLLYINLGVRNDSPVAQTTNFNDDHSKAIVQIRFLSDTSDGDLRFLSVGLEGNYREWYIEKHTMVPSMLILSSNCPGFFSNPNWHIDQPQCVSFSSYQSHIFIVGTMFGYLHLCDYNVFKHIKKSWRAHQMPVSAIRWSPFHKDIFMTSGYDNSVFVYDLENIESGHILQWTFDEAVRDVAWSPYNSTLFAVLLCDGQLLFYDIAHSKYSPLCVQNVAVTSASRPERVRFNGCGPYILISDQSGSVQIFKLSPNLRILEVPEQAIGAGIGKGKPVIEKGKKKGTRSQKHWYPGIDLKTQTGKVDRLLAMFRENAQPTLKLGAPGKKYFAVGAEAFNTKLSDGTDLKLSGVVNKGKDK